MGRIVPMTLECKARNDDHTLSTRGADTHYYQSAGGAARIALRT